MIACEYIGKIVKVTVDRAISSLHPKHGFVYEVNYGYIPNTISGDGEELDAYILGIDEAVSEFEGICIAVIHRTNDNDDKLIVVPKGANFSDDEIIKLTNFQEKWFKSVIIRNPNITKYHFGVYGVARNGNKVLAIKKARGPYKGMYDLPGGSPEKGENNNDTLKREIKEETGCKVVSYNNMRNAQIIFSNFTKLSEEQGVLLHQAVLFDVVVDGEILVDYDGHDSNGAEWIDIADLSSDNSTPLLLLGAGKEMVPIADENNIAIGCVEKGMFMTENQRPLIGVYLVIFQDNKVLLSKCKSGMLAGKYSMIAGHAEKGEKVISAIIREAKEEAGIKLSPDDLQVALTMQRPNAPYKGDPTDIIDVFVKATNYSGQIQNKEPEKCEEIAFFDIDDLPDQALPHVKQAIDLIKQNQHFYIYE